MEGENRSNYSIMDGIEDSFIVSKKQALKAAKELRYPPDVIEKIKSCTTMGQLSIVMSTARQTYL